MRPQPGARVARRLVALLLAAGAAAAAAAAVPSGELRFEQVFSERGEPAALHYRARFMRQGSAHTLEVWRDGDRRLVRRTDDAIETHVARAEDGVGFQMVVLDLRRRIETRIERDNLYRIGQFTDWFDLAHGLRHPKAGYRLSAVAAPHGAPRPLSACDWYSLEQDGHRTALCWSAREHLPLLMLDERGTLLWQVTQVARGPVPRTVLEVRDQDFVRNDADQDISGD